MRLDDVLPALREGKRIRRATWMAGEGLSLVKTFRGGYVNRGPYTPFVLNDILANDWEEEEEAEDGTIV